MNVHPVSTKADVTQPTTTDTGVVVTADIGQDLETEEGLDPGIGDEGQGPIPETGTEAEGRAKLPFDFSNCYIFSNTIFV